MKYISIIALIAFRCVGASVTLSWSPPTNGLPISSYIVAANANGVSWSIEGVTATNYTMTGLAPGVRHMFQVFAVNPVGRSGGSNIASYTPSEQIEYEVPVLQSPTNVSAFGLLFGNGTTFSLATQWEDKNTNSVGFLVTASTPEGATIKQLKTTSKNIQIPGLAYGATSSISVVAYDALGNESPASDPLVVVMESVTSMDLKTVKRSLTTQTK